MYSFLNECIKNEEIYKISDPCILHKNLKKDQELNLEDSSEIGGSRIHFPSMPVKYLADLRSRANSQQYSSIYEDRRPKIEDIERSDSKKSA